MGYWLDLFSETQDAKWLQFFSTRMTWSIFRDQESQAKPSSRGLVSHIVCFLPLVANDIYIYMIQIGGIFFFSNASARR